MPPGLQRYLPIMLVVVLVLFILPSVLKKKSTSGLSGKALAGQAIDAANAIDQSEQLYHQLHGRFAGNLADLLPAQPKLAADLVGGVSVTLDVSTDGSTYVQQVADQYVSLVRARKGSKLITSSCLVVKSASGVSCPAS